MQSSEPILRNPPVELAAIDLVLDRKRLGRTARDVRAQPHGVETISSPRIGANARSAAVHVIVATMLGFAVRTSYVLGSDFPLNDGGLFVVMTRDLIHAGFQIPITTTYNDLGIPFAYPPLGIYFLAVMTTATGIDLAELLRWVPLLLSVAGIPAFALLAHKLLHPTAALAATYAYALIPAGFAWPIMGGGLTRSLGLLFALLALTALTRALAGGSRRALLLSATLMGLTALSHPNVAVFLALSATLLAAVRFRTPAGLARLALVSAGALAFAAPWWLTVVARHGVAPFLAAATSDRGGNLVAPALGTLIRWNAWNEPLFALVSALALAGVAISLVRREFLPALWVVALAFVVPNQFEMLSAIPVALLAGIGVAAASEIPLGSRTVRTVAITGVAYLTVAAMLSFAGALEGLSAADRVAMEWVAQETPASARVLVVTTWPGETDAVGEWLPALSLRRSVVAFQGAEWLPGVAAERHAQHAGAAACAESDGDCLERLANDGVRYDYVYLGLWSDHPMPTPCCPALAHALLTDARYSLVYEGGSVLIFARR